MFGLDKKDESTDEQSVAPQDSSGVTVAPTEDTSTDQTDFSSGSTFGSTSDDTSTPSQAPTGDSGTSIPVSTPSVSDPSTPVEEPASAPEAPETESETELPSVTPDLSTLPTPSSDTPEPEAETPAVETPTETEATESADSTSEPDNELPDTVSFPGEEPEDKKEEEKTEDKEESSEETVTDTPANTEVSTSLPGDLKDLKDTTLKELAPLVSHLDLSPEEKLKTIMELYEASKDQALLKAAHDAAIELTDDTARAKALLDLVHKIDEVA